MNPDGTCETFLTVPGAGLVIPLWRLGARPELPPLRCVDLDARAGASDGVGLAQELEVRFSMASDGTDPAGEARVAATRGSHPVAPFAFTGASVDGGSCQVAADRVTCAVPGLRPGAPPRQGCVTLRAGGEGPFSVVLEGSSEPADQTDWNDRAEVFATAFPCDIVGAGSGEFLRGTPGPDRICSRTGDDRVDALAGDDTIDAGNGNDEVYPGAGRDSVETNGGEDVVWARDGVPDSVDCGTEPDVVVADRVDRLARCESVARELACTHLGTRRNDTIGGRPHPDVVCAFAGNDTVRVLGGNDAVDGGAGNDSLDGGAGRDLIHAGPGYDTVFARDRQRDTIRCGSEDDVVIADRRDVVARDCERIRRG